MTVRIEVRRHSIKDGDGRRRTIGPKGRAFAELVGSRQMRGRGFNRFFVSHIERTRQTLESYAAGAGDFDPELLATAAVPDIYLLWDRLKPLWKACHMAETRGGDMVEAYWGHGDGDVAAEAQEAYFRLFQKFAASLPDGTNALLVGHSPHLELIGHGICDMPMAGLRECEGFAILAEDGELMLEADTAHPLYNPPVAVLRGEFFAGLEAQDASYHPTEDDE